MPTNQNHDTPSTALRTASCFLASRSTAKDSGIGFQLIRSPGAPAPAGGIARLTRWPVTASTITSRPATQGPLSPAALNTMPPIIIPPRIEMEVPISTRPLPPVNSRGCNTEGRIEYFTGPNRVDCSPVQNNATSSTIRFWDTKPTAASVMMAISIAVVIRISVDFSSFSAICPASAENRKYGRMNSAGARLVYSVLSALLIPSQNSMPMMAWR